MHTDSSSSGNAGRSNQLREQELGKVIVKKITEERERG